MIICNMVSITWINKEYDDNINKSSIWTDFDRLSDDENDQNGAMKLKHNIKIVYHYWSNQMIHQFVLLNVH
jgi:hypothetical protein